MKKDKCVILTTHAMEEADILSDRIAVIVDGQIKCIGTSLFLKNNYGDGYRLSLIMKENSKPLVAIKFIQKLLPSAMLIDESGGSLVFGIGMKNMEELGVFFKIMENDEDHDFGEKGEGNEISEFKKEIKDWGLSHTTLEEVFMKVTNKKVSKYK